MIERQLEPSHHLIDLFSQQWEAKQLEYVPPEKCTSREWEIMRGKSNKQLFLDNEKLLVKEEKSVPDQPVTSSELLILTPGVAPYHKGKGKGKKGKGKKQINVLPKALQHEDNVSQDDHGRRLCFNFNLGCVIKLRMGHSAGMVSIFAAVKDALPLTLYQNTKMARRIDGLSASLSLLLVVRDWKTA